MENEKRETGSPSSPPGVGKKPYSRPEILYRERLEAMAAVCIPHPPAKANPGQCPAGPISS